MGIAGGIIVLLWCATVAPGRDQVVEARALADALNFEGAVKLAEATLLLDGLERDVLVSLYESLGIWNALLGRPTQARAAFERLLSIAPEHLLSKNLSPRTRTPYFEAKATVERIGAVRLDANPTPERDGETTHLAVTAHDTPFLPAQAVRFTYRTDDEEERSDVVSLGEGRRAVLSVRGKRVQWTATLLGARAAELCSISGEAADRAAIAGESATSAPAPPTRGWVGVAGVVMALAGGGALIAGAVEGIQSAEARRRLLAAETDAEGRVVGLSQRDAELLEKSARNQAVAANALFLTGGIVAATGIVLTVFPIRHQPVAVTHVAISQQGIIVSGRF